MSPNMDWESMRTIGSGELAPLHICFGMQLDLGFCNMKHAVSFSITPTLVSLHSFIASISYLWPFIVDLLESSICLSFILGLGIFFCCHAFHHYFILSDAKPLTVPWRSAPHSNFLSYTLSFTSHSVGLKLDFLSCLHPKSTHFPICQTRHEVPWIQDLEVSTHILWMKKFEVQIIWLIYSTWPMYWVLEHSCEARFCTVTHWNLSCFPLHHNASQLMELSVFISHWINICMFAFFLTVNNYQFCLFIHWVIV